jgi:hypothetical protein
MSHKTIKEKAQAAAHALKFPGWDPEVKEYFFNSFDSDREPWTLKESEREIVIRFFECNRNLFSNADKFFEARNDFLNSSGIKADTFNQVWFETYWLVGRRGRTRHKKVKQTKI